MKYRIDTNLVAVDGVIKAIAEACEAGALSAAFQHLYKGADDLDRGVWRKPQWRNYFSNGTVVVDQPALLANDEPDPSGKMLPCEREVYVRKDSLADFVRSTEVPADKAGASRRLASRQQVLVEIRAIYAEPGKPPNIKELPKAVLPRLHSLGLDATENQIAKIGNDPQFDGVRRKPGRTVASERAK